MDGAFRQMERQPVRKVLRPKTVVTHFFKVCLGGVFAAALALSAQAQTDVSTTDDGRAIDVTESNDYGTIPPPPVPAASSPRPNAPSFGMSFGSKRIALVIGNQNYKYTSVLANPKKDASDMAESLEVNGDFEVLLGIDLDKFEFDQIVKEFEARLRQAGSQAVGMVYYAGHGVAYDGVNYLLPVDVDFSTGDKYLISESSVNLNRIVSALEPTVRSIDVVILDACRNNPFIEQGRKSIGGASGWAKIEQAGLFVAYGTAPGSTASDGRPGENGVFTKFILEQLQAPGQTLDQMFNTVKREVSRETQYQGAPQTPVVFSGITKPFSLHPCQVGENCGSGQITIIYGLIAGMVLLVLGSVLYIRKLALANHQGFRDTLKDISEPLTRPIWGGKRDEVQPQAHFQPAIPGVEPESEARVLGYLRHNRHNRELGQIREGETLTIGREKGSGVDVIIKDTRNHIARVQTRLGWDAHRKQFWIMDLGSRNGTYLGPEEKLKPHEIYYINAGQTFFLASKYHPMTILKAED